MKKTLLILLTTTVFFACANDKTGTNTGESGPSTTNVQNVNGNQPDTSSGITLDSKQSADTTKKDSVPR